MIPLGLLLGLIGAYLLGSLPFGYWAARLRGTNIRETGSGNIGATNVLRTLGPGVAVPVLLLDAGKGYFGAAMAAALAARFGGDPALAAVLGGLAAFAGHNWSFLLGFSGGKGVAAAAGAAVYLIPVPLAAGVVTVVLVVALTRYVSLGSIVAVTVAALLTVFGTYPLAHKVFAVVAASVIVYRHRANIRRLLAGTEARFGQRIKPGRGA